MCRQHTIPMMMDKSSKQVAGRRGLNNNNRGLFSCYAKMCKAGFSFACLLGFSWIIHTEIWCIVICPTIKLKRNRTFNIFCSVLRNCFGISFLVLTLSSGKIGRTDQKIRPLLSDLVPFTKSLFGFYLNGLSNQIVQKIKRRLITSVCVY